MNQPAVPMADAEVSNNEIAARALIQIGRRIRELRKGRGLTLQQLAEASGISSSMLSLVERGLASPSIGSLVVLTDVLGSSMSDLMAIDTHADDLIVRGSDVQPVETSEHVVRRVMKEDRSNGISIAINEYAPQTGSSLTALSHEGFEYGFLIEGQLTVEVDGESFELGVGDLISYASRRPHRIWNHGKTVARTIWMNTDRR